MLLQHKWLSANKHRQVWICRIWGQKCTTKQSQVECLRRHFTTVDRNRTFGKIYLSGGVYVHSPLNFQRFRLFGSLRSRIKSNSRVGVFGDPTLGAICILARCWCSLTFHTREQAHNACSFSTRWLHDCRPNISCLFLQMCNNIR